MQVDEEELRRRIVSLLESRGFLRNHASKADTGQTYTFGFWHPGTEVCAEIYRPKPPQEVRNSEEYEQLCFLVEYHIKLVHRKFPDVKIGQAYAIGEFTPRVVQYAKIHGGMMTLTPEEALRLLPEVIGKARPGPW